MYDKVLQSENMHLNVELKHCKIQWRSQGGGAMGAVAPLRLARIFFFFFRRRKKGKRKEKKENVSLKLSLGKE